MQHAAEFLFGLAVFVLGFECDGQAITGAERGGRSPGFEGARNFFTQPVACGAGAADQFGMRLDSTTPLETA